MNAIILFAIATIANVILSTVRSIFTIKGTALTASLSNAICYGFYTYVIVLTANGEVDLMVKIAITAAANFIGVYLVKAIEKKAIPDKLWKIDFTCHSTDTKEIEKQLQEVGAPYRYAELGKHINFIVFSENQKQSRQIAKIVKAFNGKWFISENNGILE